MMFTSLALAMMLPVATLASADNDHGIEKRDVYAYTNTNGLRYRTCPNTGCTAIGQLDAGYVLYLQCYTTSGTTVVEGDNRWAKISQPSDMAGYWVALAGGNYVMWASDLPYC